MSSSERSWRCAGCGHHPEGADAPERCPVCGRSRVYFVAATSRQRPTRSAPRAVTPLTLAALARPVDVGSTRASFVTSRLPLAVPPPPRAPRPPSPTVTVTAPARLSPDAVTFVAAILRLFTAGASGSPAPRPPQSPMTSPTSRSDDDDDEPGRFALIEVD